jgi:hypothetical protein
MMILALASEVSALQARLDTHERLAEAGQPPVPGAVEAYLPDESVEAARAASRRSLIDRITRVLLEPGSSHRGTSQTHDAGPPQESRG